MRQRRVTGIEERLAPFADLILRGAEECPAEESAAAYPLRWHERPSPRYILPGGFGRTYAEFGCGRGLFINTIAAADPEGLYIGVEGCKTILIRALIKTREAGLENARYIDGFVNDAASAFAEGSLDGVFLNFSDPWPKIRHAGRRLTAPAKAAAYHRILKPGGFIVLKTDKEEFYRYSGDTLSEAGFMIEGGDVGASDYVFDVAGRGAATPTEYELKFRAQGFSIFCLIAVKRI